MLFLKQSLCVAVMLASGYGCLAAPVPESAQYGPKVEPPAMGSDFQPLLWQGTDAAFATDTVGFGICQQSASSQAASTSSNSDVQHLAAESLDLQKSLIKKMRSMAKVISFHFPKTAPECPQASNFTGLSGAKFDKAYLDYLSGDNADELARFRAEAGAQANSWNHELKKFADINITRLSDQQSAIDTLRSKLTGASSK